MSEHTPPPVEESHISLKMPDDDLSRSVVGFMAALIAGALIPRTVGYLLRRVFFRAFKEIFILAFAGFLADLLASFISRSSSKDAS